MCHIVSISMTSSLINNQDCELLTTWVMPPDNHRESYTVGWVLSP